MRENFISLYKVLEAVGIRISIPTAEADQYAEKPIDDTDFSKMLARHPVVYTFQNSRAAIVLLNVLFGKENEVTWFEKVGPGFPILSDAAGAQAKDILVDRAKREKFFKAWVNTGRKQADPAETFVQEIKLDRALFVGFAINQIIGVLDRENVPHNLSKVDVPENSSMSVDAQIVPTTNESTKPRRFNGPMGGPLTLAVQAASDPKSKFSVWDVLVSFAKAEIKPSPITGYIDGKGVQFLDRGVTRFFTLDDVGSRVRERKRASPRQAVE